MATGKRIYRSDDRIIGGVCAGIAEYFDVDPTILRIAYVVLTIFTAFCGIILYPFLWIVIPSKR